MGTGAPVLCGTHEASCIIERMERAAAPVEKAAELTVGPHHRSGLGTRQSLHVCPFVLPRHGPAALDEFRRDICAGLYPSGPDRATADAVPFHKVENEVCDTARKTHDPFAERSREKGAQAIRIFLDPGDYLLAVAA